jgi:hypothetical protein
LTRKLHDYECTGGLKSLGDFIAKDDTARLSALLRRLAGGAAHDFVRATACHADLALAHGMLADHPALAEEPAGGAPGAGRCNFWRPCAGIAAPQRRGSAAWLRASLLGCCLRAASAPIRRNRHTYQSRGGAKFQGTTAPTAAFGGLRRPPAPPAAARLPPSGGGETLLFKGGFLAGNFGAWGPIRRFAPISLQTATPSWVPRAAP